MLVMASYTTNRTPPPGPSLKTLGRNPLYNARKLQSHTSLLPLFPHNVPNEGSVQMYLEPTIRVLNPRLDNIEWGVEHRADGSSHGANHKIPTFLARNMLCTQMSNPDDVHFPKMHLPEANGWRQSIHHSRHHVSIVSTPNLCRMQRVLHCRVFGGHRKTCSCISQPSNRLQCVHSPYPVILF